MNSGGGATTCTSICNICHKPVKWDGRRWVHKIPTQHCLTEMIVPVAGESR